MQLEDIAGLGKVAKHLAPVANNLLNKISKGIGTIFKPTDIRRIAKAEADAKITLASAEIATDLQKRAVQRWLYEEERKQANLESVIKEVIPQLEETAKPDEIDDDWLFEYLDRIKKVTDTQLQSLWAKILAGEANRPGTFTKATLHALAMLEKTDAALFTDLCRFLVDIGGEPRVFLFELDDTIYSDNRVTFHTLNHLEDIGLISISLLGYGMGNIASPEIPLTYGGERTILRIPPDRDRLNAGKVILTDVGKRLCPLARVNPVDGLVDYLAREWKIEGVTITTEYGPIITR